MKKCKICGRSEPEVKFFSAGVVRGKGYVRRVCNECRIEQKKVRHQILKQKISGYKADRGCSRCAENDPVCLDFHHVGSDKVINLGNAIRRGWSWERMLVEIQKCSILCANCHRKLHAELQRDGAVVSMAAS